MKHAPLKKLIVHILATNALKPDVIDYPLEQNAFLICAERDNNFLDNTITQNKLIIIFPDVESKHWEVRTLADT